MGLRTGDGGGHSGEKLISEKAERRSLVAGREEGGRQPLTNRYSDNFDLSSFHPTSVGQKQRFTLKTRKAQKNTNNLSLLPEHDNETFKM